MNIFNYFYQIPIMFISDIWYYAAYENLVCFYQGGLGGRGEQGGMGGVGGDGGDGGFAGVFVYQGRVITDGSQQVQKYTILSLKIKKFEMLFFLNIGKNSWKSPRVIFLKNRLSFKFSIRLATTLLLL